MDTIQVPVRTTTDILYSKTVGDNFNIFCAPSENDDGTQTPSIYRSTVLEAPTIVDDVKGMEGELILSSNESTPGVIENGELTITVDNDIASKYSVEPQQGDLIYER